MAVISARGVRQRVPIQKRKKNPNLPAVGVGVGDRVALCAVVLCPVGAVSVALTTSCCVVVTVGRRSC